MLVLICQCCKDEDLENFGLVGVVNEVLVLELVWVWMSKGLFFFFEIVFILVDGILGCFLNDVLFILIFVFMFLSLCFELFEFLRF